MTAVPKQEGQPAPTLAELSERWARAKVLEETARREAERLRAELLERGAGFGYEDEHLVVTRTTSLDLDNRALRHVLEEERCLEEASERKLVAKRVHAIALFNEKVARAVEAATTEKPRFEQKAKKTP